MRKSRQLPGKRVAIALERVGIVLNFNTVPNASELQKPLFPDGVRMGTPALTTRGLQPQHMDTVAGFIDRTLEFVKRGKIEKGSGLWADPSRQGEIRAEVEAFIGQFPTFRY